jgi:D-alanyl-D-alanine carboxypeptidase/POTRA domain, FtsQ-type
VLSSPKRLPARFNRRVQSNTRALVRKRHGRQRQYALQQWLRSARRIRERWVQGGMVALHFLPWIIGVIVVMLVGIAIFSPLLHVREIIIVRSDRRVDVEQVHQSLSSLYGEHMLFLNQKNILPLLETSVPDVRKATIDKRYPSTVVIRLEVESIVASIEIVDPTGNVSPAITGTGSNALGDYLTSDGMYVTYPPSLVQSGTGTAVVRIVDWGVRPEPWKHLLDIEILERVAQAEQIMRTQFGMSIRQRVVYLRSREFHLQTPKYSLWFDMRSSLEKHRSLSPLCSDCRCRRCDALCGPPFARQDRVSLASRFACESATESHVKHVGRFAWTSTSSTLYPMIGPLLSVLLLGTVPVWGIGDSGIPAAHDLRIAPPLASDLAASVPRSLAGSLSASGVIIIDLESAQTVFAHRPLERRPMASLTKIMTALLIVENHGLDERVHVTSAVAAIRDNAIGLQIGDTYALRDVLSAMIVHSANDAAVALAVHDAGSEDAFVEKMNARAAALGLTGTVYKNVMGFDEAGQYSTPRDIGILSTFVLRFPAIADRMAMDGGSITSASGTVLGFIHTHQLLRQRNAITAGKTGTTDEARQCLLSVFEEGDRRYAAVLLHSDDRYGDMRRILSAFAL